ncbi:MAG: sterol carrier family protein [Propionibacteriaceae bacterium]|nr:sterol carrier family protein [Propionibacteriaceae bacterium]
MRTEADRVRALARALARRYPGRTIEVRIPPWAAVQVGFGEGPSHSRGTPPNVVETDPETFLLLASGELSWDAADPARLRVSGAQAAELRRAFPFQEER